MLVSVCMKYRIFTYGCQMNHSDSEKIAFLLEKSGHRPATDRHPADLIVVNACSVRQAAVHRMFDKINKAKGKKIILAGCVLKTDKQKLKNKVELWHPDEYFGCQPLRQNSFSAYVPIMTGCNNFCSYCVVPYTRGREKSRPAKEIIAEIKSLVGKKYKEIILLGQNVNSYQASGINFPRLLKKINALPGNFWLTFLTSHPKDMSDELITAIAECKKIMPYVHLPVQNGDDEILKRMNRHYTVAHYKNLVKKIRSAFKKNRPGFPPVAVTTDIIVGFPGETKKQFNNTAKLCREISFDMIYFAKYSPRPDTAASRLKDDVPPQEKRRRAQKINEILKKTASANNKKYLNETIKVLIDKIEKNSAFGHTATNKALKLPAKNLKPGDMTEIKIEKASAWGLSGNLAK